MTDKVQKIREEVEKLHREYRNKKGAFYYRKALRTVLYLIDSMQKEPVSEQNLSNVQRLGKNWKEPVSEDKMTISKEWCTHCMGLAADRPHRPTGGNDEVHQGIQDCVLRVGWF